MHIAKTDVPVKINIPGAIARQKTDFGDAKGYGKIAGEYFSLGAGTDIAPLLKGLENDLCQSPHWGYLLRGRVRIKHKHGEAVLKTGDVYYLEPGHIPVFEEDTEILEFSPKEQYQRTIEVAARNMAAASK